MPKLTMNFVETKIQAPEHGQIIIRDDDLAGFGLRVTKGSMSYIAECRVAGKVRRITIGKHGQPWTPDSARKQALVILGSMAAGIDPVAQKVRKRCRNYTIDVGEDLRFDQGLLDHTANKQSCQKWENEILRKSDFGAIKSGASEQVV